MFNININEVEEIANKKAYNKGGFESGILLLDTTEYSLINTVSPTDNTLFNSEFIDTKRSKSNSLTKKAKRLYFDNTILNIPYICGESQTIKFPIGLVELRTIEVSYNSKNISIKFLKEKKKEDPNQLVIDFPQ